MKKKEANLVDLLRSAFEAGEKHKMQPFTTDLMNEHCPDFETWLAEQVIENGKMVRTNVLAGNGLICRWCGQFQWIKPYEKG